MDKVKAQEKLDELKLKVSELEKEINCEGFNFAEWYEFQSRVNLFSNEDLKQNIAEDYSPYGFYENRQLAQQAENRRVIEYILRKEIEALNDGWEPNWNGKHDNILIYWDLQYKKADMSYFSTIRYSPNWFYLKDSETAKKLIDKLERDYDKPILKIYLTGEE